MVAVLNHGSPVKQKAIALRPALSEQVSDAVISMGDEIALSALSQNASARIGKPRFDKAIDRRFDMVIRKSHIPL